MTKKKKVSKKQIIIFDEAGPIERPLSKVDKLKKDKLDIILDELDERYGRIMEDLDD